MWLLLSHCSTEVINKEQRLSRVVVQLLEALRYKPMGPHSWGRPIC